MCAVLAASVLLTFAACNADTYGEGDPISQYTFKDCYHLGDERYSFANLTVKSVHSELYYAEVGTTENGLGWWHQTNTTSHYIVLECTVEEDFYGRIESGTTVYLPIELDSTTYEIRHDWESPVKDKDPDEVRQVSYYEELAIREFFCEGQRYIACFREEDAPRLKSSQTDEQCDFSHLALNIFLPSYELIPISESKVDFSGLYSFLSDQGYRCCEYSERCEDYTDYIYNGMTIEDVSENLRALAANQK